MSALPQWLLDKVGGYNGGQRLPKRTHYVPPKPTYDGQRWLPSYYRQLPPKPPVDTIDNDLLRFWKIEEFQWDGKQAKLYECRACGNIHYTVEACRKHYEKGCAKELVEAYKLLLLDHKCVVCDQPTVGEKWGVPLCTDGMCQRHWKETEATPSALLEALGLLRAGRAL